MQIINMAVHETPVRTERENRIFMNGYVYGKREGAKTLIQMLQSDINDNGRMEDAHEIKMLIFNAWKAICLDDANFIVTDEPPRPTAALSTDYWDCECDEKYIHRNDVNKCSECGALRDEMPDSRQSEVDEGTHIAEGD